MAGKRTNGRKRGGRRIGYAVAGLGHIAQTAVLPAFKNARNSRLVALISDDEEKREKPMASNESDCRRMIAACDDAGVRLMIAYRLHFEREPEPVRADSPVAE